MGILFQGEQQDHFLTGLFELFILSLCGLTYGVIWTGKFVMTHKIQVAIGICSIVAVAIAVKIIIWMKERNKLVKVSVTVENNDNR